MIKIAVVHFMPLEYYPPTTNFLNIISSKEEIDTRVWTTHNNKNRATFINKNINRINRVTLPSANEFKILRLFRYVFFNLNCLVGLILTKPDKIIYYESFSAGPVYLYLKFFAKTTKLIIHFHEYFSPSWYKTGMQVVSLYHKWENKYLFKRAAWISQTNEDRISLFLKDNPNLESKRLFLLPNYPPENWISSNQQTEIKLPLKTVYIGTLSLDYSYIKEYCLWVRMMNGKVIFHIYGYNYNEETLDYLKSLHSPFIKFYEGGIDYYDVPTTLRNYDFGLILYKAITDNYKYNESNKLFEYLVCNLRVLYSDKMLGIRNYNAQSVKAIDFDNLQNLKIDELISMKGIENQSNYTNEKATKELIDILIK